MADRSAIFMRVLIVSAIVLVLLIAALLVLRQADQSRTDLPVLGEVPQFSVVDQEGRTFTNEDLLGKLSVIDFIFTRCQGACPIMAVNMGDLYGAYRDHDSIQFLSFTVDPEYDSLSVLQQYAIDHGVTDDRWRFLWAPMSDLAPLLEDGFKLSAADLPSAHPTKFVLVDRQGRIRAYYDGLDKASTKVLKSQIAELAAN